MTHLKPLLLPFGVISTVALWLGSGCAGLQSAQGGADQTKSGVDSLKSGVDQTRSQVQSDKEKAEKAKEEKEKKESGEADEDSTRLKAKDAPINEALDDSVDFKKFDRNDWRKFQLTGKPGILTVELHWDNEPSEINVDVYDRDGVNVGKSPPRLAGQSFKRILVEVSRPELYFVRVSAPTEKDASIYTLRVRWKGGQIMAPPQVAQPTPPPPGTPPGTTPPPGTPTTPPPPVPFAQDPTKVLGRIVQAYKEGSTWTLLIDKGSSQRVRAGLSGSVLEGADGDKLLDGANFTISQVMSGSKSQAQASLAKPLGRNSRVVINLK